ncbi:MMPL family transporter [Stakelama sediminis]|uniref:Membrane transport protein MMPL domain-containing protein n=1 Tax=Stakelama sediminis TaxID=463200 RepID=A0A840Z188_9SPHN|nr:MMPL family transporter [Stakelama sediminis]MBB5719663.1 hypothetical protein [Stakelama sediminis]
MKPLSLSTLRTPVPALVGSSVRRPWATLLITALLTLAALFYAAGHFAMTTDTGALISPKVEWRQQESAIENAFPQLRDVMLIVIDGKTPELAESASDALAKKLGSDKQHFRMIQRPDGGDFFAREGLLFQSQKEVQQTTANLIQAQPMLGPLAADPSLRGVATSLSTMLTGVQQGTTSLSRIDKPMTALADALDKVVDGKPAFFSWQRLLNDGKSGMAAPTRKLILAQPVLNHADLMPGEAASDAVDAAAKSLGLDAAHGVSVRLTGEVPLADQEFATLEENIGLVAFVMLAAMLLTLWFATRSAKIVAAILITIVAGLIVTTALGLLAVEKLNLISVAFIPLFVGLGVDFGIQISVRFNAERVEGFGAADALRRAAGALGAPLLLAAAAIFLGFAAFLPTAYVGIAQLGIIAGLGMIIALAFSVTFLPALLLLLNPGKPSRDVGFSQMAPVDAFLERRRKSVLWAFVLALLVSIALLPFVRFDFNPMHLRDPHSPAMATLTDLTRDPDRTPNTIEALAPNVQAADALAKKLGALPEVSLAVTLDSFVPDNQQPKLALIQDASMLLDLTINPFDTMPPPSDSELVQALRSTAQQLRSVAQQTAAPANQPALRLATAFERLATASPQIRAKANAVLSKPLDTTLNQIRSMLQAQPVSRDTLPDQLRRDWVAPDGRARVELFPSGNSMDNRVLERFRAAVARVTPAISGLPVATQAAASTVAGAFIQAGVIALVLVSLLLFFVLRSVREVAFTLAPVVLSGFLTLGTCVLIGQPINFANIIAFPLLFGVGVAFHIYFVMAWRAGARDLLQSSLARAVLFSALATGTAFGSLWLSHHPGTASMGKILMISLAWTLVCALIFEPALLGPPDQSREEEGAVAAGS